MQARFNSASAPAPARSRPARSTAGQQAEALAAEFLQTQGLSILARNWQVRGGEIDLICRHGRMLVFVEVRLRQCKDFGGAAASITTGKQRRIILAARHYLAGKNLQPCRFDVVLLERLDVRHLQWLQDAFQPESWS